MPVFETSKGVPYECEFCGLASVGVLYVDLLGTTLREALEVFGNPENTTVLTYRTIAGATEYKGFKVLLGVERVHSAVRISLRRAYEGEVIE